MTAPERRWRSLSVSLPDEPPIACLALDPDAHALATLVIQGLTSSDHGWRIIDDQRMGPDGNGPFRIAVLETIRHGRPVLARVIVAVGRVG